MASSTTGINSITVCFFARARDLAGLERVRMTLPVGATIGDVRNQLAHEFPRLAGLLTRSALAIDNEFAEDDSAVPPGAEVAVLPPVSGG